MTIDKLPSGSYRIREQIQGKRYSVIVDHKPSVFEAKELMSAKVYGSLEDPFDDSVMDYANRYILKCRADNKSPTTITNYISMIRNTPEWFCDLHIKTITPAIFQKMIDEYAENHSPKSTKNICGFYKAVFGDLSHLKNSTIKLPKRIKKAEYEPTTKDVRRILDYIKGSDYESVINLCAIGLRRGEALAITKKDLDEDNVLTINKDMIKDGNRYVIKNHPKTEASNRRIRIPDHVAELIRSQDKVYDLSPNSINRYLHRVQDALEIPRFRLHILRHYAAAFLHKNGFTDRQIMSFMGWETAETMNRVYNYNLDPADSQKSISDVFATNWK